MNELNKAHPNLLKVLKLEGILYSLPNYLIPLIGYITYVVAFPAKKWILLIVIFSLVCSILYTIYKLFITPFRIYKNFAYYITEEEVVIRKGIWTIVHAVIPLNRIQHVETFQSISDKWYGLSNVGVSTAGESFSINGINMDVADSIRIEIARLAKIGETDVY